MTKNNKNFVLATLLAVSAVLSVYEIVLGLNEVDSGVALNSAWAVFFAVLVAVWARADARTRKEHASFDFGLYVFLFWPVVLPYYMVKSRGVEGFVGFLGFGALYTAPFFLGLTAYVYS